MLMRVLLFMVSLFMLPLSFAGDLVRLNDVLSGSLLFYGQEEGLYEPATELSTDVDMQISGMVARVTLSQHFRNEGENFLEAIYVFPLPEDAAVDTLRMRIAERIIEGEIQEKEEARATYEAAVEAGQQTSLVEQNRPNLFTTNIANIPPGEEITVEISYLQTLHYDANDEVGSFRLRFPLAITPRYIPGQPLDASRLAEGEAVDRQLESDGTGWAHNTDAVPDASQITPPYHDGEPHPVSIHANLNTGFPIASLESLHHPIVQQELGQHLYSIDLATGDMPATRDFVLRWSPDVGSVPEAALFKEQWQGDDYALVMLMPPQLQNVGQTPPREMIFILDTSGSMGGTSIVQAKASLNLALNRLEPRDRFNIIEFDSETTQLYPEPKMASQGNINAARLWVDRLEADNGTEMAEPLERSMRGRAPRDYLRQIVFITDGSVGNEAQLFQQIERNIGTARLFTVGIGSAPNSYFMRKAAEFGRGTFTYIGDISNVQDEMVRLFEKLENPVLTGLEVQLPQGSDAFPATIPDLYAGEPVLMHVRLPDNVRDNAQDSISLVGSHDNQNWTRNLSLDGGGSEAGISQLWARAKIESFYDRGMRDYDYSYEKQRQDITEVALHHHLVSEYTSLVAVDKTPVRPQDAALDSESVPQNTPDGQMLSRYPSTATAANLYLMLALLLCAVALVMLKARSVRSDG